MRILKMQRQMHSVHTLHFRNTKSAVMVGTGAGELKMQTSVGLMLFLQSVNLLRWGNTHQHQRITYSHLMDQRCTMWDQ